MDEVKGYMMSGKEKFDDFCKSIYVPVYSKSWWLDAVCSPENWDVWLYEQGSQLFAAMPYYYENKGKYKYITKAPLSQNNGILFKYPSGVKETTKRIFEEKVIDAACKWIDVLNIDVYEQQFQTTFNNWLPFFWNCYEAVTRYTYVFSKDRLKDLTKVWQEIDKKKRSKIKKGYSLCEIKENLDPDLFYDQVEKTFSKQGLVCPFSRTLWLRLYEVAINHNSGKIIYAVNQSKEIVSTVFLVWDEERMYQLISGGDAGLQHYEGKSALVWYAIQQCAKKGLTYDFEGSVIKRISKSNRLFGAESVPYFRIRKVFNPEIIRQESEEKIMKIKNREWGGENVICSQPP